MNRTFLDYMGRPFDAQVLGYPPEPKAVGNAVEIGLDDLYRLFDPVIHVRLNAAAKLEGATHLVCFENLDFTSSQLGARSAVVVGDRQTYAIGGALAPGAHVGDVPSQFRHPVAYASVEGVKRASEEVGSESSQQSTHS